MEVHQQQEQQHQEQQEQEQQVALYIGDESQLITRNTINNNDRAKEYWEGVPRTTKNLIGWTQKKLNELFSLLVGSDKDAEQVIEKIEPEALKELMAYVSQHRMGLSKDNLPPGFSLAVSRLNRGLILCFNGRAKKTS